MFMLSTCFVTGSLEFGYMPGRGCLCDEYPIKTLGTKIPVTFPGWQHFTCLVTKLLFFFFLWLCWVFVSVQGLSLVVASGGHSSSRCAGLSLSRPLLLRSTGSRRAGSVIVAHRPSRSAACGIFPDQGSNPCPLHWQADSQPLRHQGSPKVHGFNLSFRTYPMFNVL